MAVPRGLIATAFRITVTLAVVSAFAAPVAAIPDWLKDPSYGDPVDLSKRHNLEQPISLEREDITVADFFQWLDDEHDIRLKAEAPALTKHLAIFVHDRPAWEVLEAVAGSMHAEWRLSLTNLWLRLSHAPDDFEGLSLTFQELLYEANQSSGDDFGPPETRKPSVADRMLSDWVQQLTSDDVRQLYSSEGLKTDRLQSDSTHHFLDFLRELSASAVSRQLKPFSLRSLAPYIVVGEPGSTLVLWVAKAEEGYTVGYSIGGHGWGAGGSTSLPEGFEFAARANAPGITDFLKAVREEEYRRNPQLPPGHTGAAEASAIWSEARKRGYAGDPIVSNVQRYTSRRTPGMPLRSPSDWEWAKYGAQDRVDAGLKERLLAVGADVPKGLTPAAAARWIADKGEVSVVTLVRDGRASQNMIAAAPSLMESVGQLGNALQTEWCAYHRVIYGAPRLRPEPATQFVPEFQGLLAEYLPHTWRRAMAQAPRREGALDSANSPLDVLAAVSEVLTDRERNILKQDFLFWQDLQPWQQERLTRAFWDNFLRRLTELVPPQVQERYEKLRNAPTLRGLLKIMEDEDTDTVGLWLEGDPEPYAFTLPPGILAHLMKLKQQADAEKTSATAPPPPH